MPKLESSKDMFIQRDKFVADFRSYKDHFQEQRQAQIEQLADQQKAEQEEKKEEGTVEAPVNPEEQLSAAQIDQIEKDISRRLKKERTLEAGMKQVRERAPFHL